MNSLHTREAWKKKLEQALKLELSYPFRVFQKGSPSAVLLLLSLDQEGDLELLMTRRTQSVDTHKGQYALPGGRLEEEDLKAQGLLTTALRETEEEVGVERGQVEVLGKLPQLWTPSGFLISPHVGLTWEKRDNISLRVNPEEIDEAFWLSFSTLHLPGVYRQESRMISGTEVKTDVFQVSHHKIWGATGSILKNLFQRLEKIS